MAPSSPEKHRVPPDFEGPITDRHTTDIFFLLLKICSWAAMTAIFAIAYPESNFWTVVRPVDYLGNICGSDFYSDKPHLQYTDLSGNGICTASCYNGPVITNNPTAWVDAHLTCRYDIVVGAVLNGAVLNAAQLVAQSYCLPKYQSLNVFNRCFPRSYTLLNTYFDAASASNYQGTVNDLMNTAERFASDVWHSAPILFGCGLGASFVLAFLFLLILRIPFLASITTWTALLTIPALLGALGYFSYSVHIDYKNNALTVEDEWQTTALLVTAIVLWVISGLTILFAIGVRKRVNLAIKCTKATARAVCAIPIIVFYPLFQLFGFVCYLTVWVVYLFTVIGMGKLTDGVVNINGTQVHYSYYEYTDLAKYAFWFLLFELFWTAQYIIGIGEITLSLGFAKWYFTIDKSSVSSGDFIQSNTVCLRYHMGTAAFGSLVVAIVQIIRAIFSYINAKIEAMERMDPTSSMLPYRTLSRILRGCFCVCLWCLENLIKFINKNAYVQTAIFGTSFCTSAKNAWQLIARNILRVLALTLVSTLTFVLVKLWVIFGTGVVTFYVLQYLYEVELYSIYGICILAGILGWFVADMFTDVMEVGCATILQCYLADEEIFGGIGEYCPSELKNFFKGIAQDSKELKGGVAKNNTDSDEELDIDIEVQRAAPPKRGRNTAGVVTH